MVIYLPAFSYISIISLKAGFFVEGAIFAFAILILGTLCYRLWKELYLPKVTLRIFSGLLALVWAFTIFQRITFGADSILQQSEWRNGRVTHLWRAARRRV